MEDVNIYDCKHSPSLQILSLQRQTAAEKKESLRKQVLMSNLQEPSPFRKHSPSSLNYVHNPTTFHTIAPPSTPSTRSTPDRRRTRFSPHDSPVSCVRVPALNNSPMVQVPSRNVAETWHTGVPVFYEYPDRPHGIAISPSRLIEQHLSEIRKRISLHDQSSQYYEKWNKVLGYPIKLISGFLSSTMMYTIASQNHTYINFINLSMSGFLLILSTSKEHLQYDKKNKSHDISSKLYTNLLRSIEKRLSVKNSDTPEISVDEKNDMFKDLVEQMTIIEQFDLTIPNHIIKNFNH